MGITGAFSSVGSTVAGFRITAADAPRTLALAGRHRLPLCHAAAHLRTEVGTRWRAAAACGHELPPASRPGRKT